METPEYVWYAVYGSNLRFERLRCYLRGGTPEGSSGRQPGALDPTDPIQDTEYSTNWTLYFARESSNWQNRGVAFLQAPAGDTQQPELSEVLAGSGTLCRIYQLRFEQFLDVLLQENDCDPRTSPELRERIRQLLIKEVSTETPGHCFDLPESVLADSWYRRIVRLGQREAKPVFSFTSDRDLSPRPPAPAYLRVIALGLWQTYARITTAQVGTYLARTSGLPLAETTVIAKAAATDYQRGSRSTDEEKPGR